MNLQFLKEPQRIFLKEGNYLKEQTPEERYCEIVEKIREYEHLYSDGLADRISILLEKNILSPSTPTLGNFGRKKDKNSKTQNLPCSCNIVGVENSIYGIYSANLEVAMLSKLGAGVGIDFTQIDQKGTEIEKGFFTNPKMDWIEPIVDTSQKVSQNSMRRGYGVPFLSIEDIEFDDLIKSVEKTNDNAKGVLIDNTIGIVLPIGFRDKLKNDKESQRKWLKLITQRKKGGQVYIVDIENLNKNQSPVYKKLKHTVSQTNICTEVVTPFYEDKTFACIIAALNLVHWDIIKQDEQIIKDCFMFLDIIVEEYIKLTENIKGLEKARKSAIEKRDIGLGTLGFHELLQFKNMPFGGIESRFLNKEIYSHIRKIGEEITKEMAQKLGSPKMCEEANMIRRNVSLIAVAPNKSTGFLCDSTSLGIEPFFSNIFIKNLANIQYIYKNKNLEKLLIKKNKNTDDIWSDISKNLGSVQHLDFLTKEEKSVFKTFSEISPKDIIDLCSDRQVYIDMAQSINLVFRPNYTLKDIHEIHKYAFEKDIKTLYYAYSQAHAALEQNGENWDTCESCSD